MTIRRFDSKTLWFAKAAALLTGVAALVFVCYEPLDHGYGRYSTMAEAMARTGEWIVPRLSGEVYVDKPPLFIWLIALPLKFLERVPEWVSHLPNLVASALSLLMCYGILRFQQTGRYRDNAAKPVPVTGMATGASCGVLVLATMWEFAEQARGERLDPVFAVLLTGAYVSFFFAERRVAAGWGATTMIGACGAALGLAIMVKGPVALVLFITVALPYSIWSKRERRRSILPAVFCGLSALTVVALPWPVLFVERLGYDRAVSLIANADIATRDEPWTYYFGALPVALAPWCLLVPALIGWLLAQRPWRVDPLIRFAVCWITGPMLALQASPIRNSRYLLPVLPAIAILFSRLVNESSDKPGGGRWRDWRKYALLVPVVAAPVAAFAGVAALAIRGASWAAFALAAVAIILVPASIISFRAIQREEGRVNILHLVGGILLISLAAFDVVRAIEFARHNFRPRCEAVLGSVPVNAPCYAIGVKTDDSWVLPLILRRDVSRLDSVADAPDEGSYIVCGEKAVEPVTAYFGSLAHRLGDFELGRREVVLFRLDRRP